MFGRRNIARVWLGLAWFAGILPVSTRAVEPPSNPLIAQLIARIEPTQVRVDRVVANGRANFQATVIEIGPERLVLLTSAHCVPDMKPGDILELSLGKLTWKAKITTVALNPSYRQDDAFPGPGPDSALVCLDATAETGGWTEASRALRAADLTNDPGVRPRGEVVSTLIIDQDGTAHVVRAGNFRNPRWLEWGRSLQLRPGDSGSGIFVAKPDSNGGARVVLIGSVSVRDLEGGGGTLVWRKERWVSQIQGVRR